MNKNSNRTLSDEQPAVNKNHKDRLFRFIFQDKASLLMLYNALNGTNYQNPDDLEINTLENAVFLSMKNDLSFLIYGVLNLYEHQSSQNPNMPLRNLIYTVDLIKGFISQHGFDIYGSRLIKLPTPQAVVFYNGKKEEPERQVLKLSDSYEVSGKEASLEFSTIMININYGKNQELMENCRPLMEYSVFIAKIRHYEAQSFNLGDAVATAVNDCIREGILKDLLLKHRSEVTSMILDEYNEQQHIENEKRWSREEGLAQGLARGKEEGIYIFIDTLLEVGIECDTIIQKLIGKYHLTESEAAQYLRNHSV
ncbi:MAG: hypothetical protein Q4B70_10750 [Lachnospiraceae bacterium]|nr:hypothetical protein [Lachnospiraceae bacterium]